MKTGLIEAYSGDQLVVATPHVRLIRDHLSALGVNSPEKGTKDPSIPKLDLTLINVDISDRALNDLDRDGAIRARVRESKWPGQQPPAGCPSALDVLCERLRQDFRERYDGWIPEFGKNRMTSPIRGLPYWSGGADDDPYTYSADRGDFYPKLTGNPAPGGGTKETASTNGVDEAVAKQDWPLRPSQPGEHARVALLDTRLYPHRWLAGGYYAAATRLLEPPATGGSTLALAGHATFIAGLILKQAPGALLIVRPVLGEKATGTVWDAVDAMAKLIGSGVHILNLSIGCYTDDSQPPLVLTRAVRALSPEILLVAAAGNHGAIRSAQAAGIPPPAWASQVKPDTPVWPAAFDNVVAVGASDADGDVAAFTPPRAQWINVIAPGQAVRSTYLDWLVHLEHPEPDTPRTQAFNGYAFWDGTSFAAATVSGAVAARITPDCGARQAYHKALEEGAAGMRPFRPAGAPSPHPGSP